MWILKVLVLVGVLLVLASRSKYHVYELSPRMTTWGWVLFGVGLTGIGIVAKLEIQAGWSDLEILVRIVACAIGFTAALVGVYRLRRLAEIGPDPARFGRSRANYRRGWMLTWSGLAVTLAPVLTPGIAERTFDGSRASMVLMAMLVTGSVLMLIGYRMLFRNRMQDQMPDDAPRSGK